MKKRLIFTATERDRQIKKYPVNNISKMKNLYQDETIKFNNLFVKLN